MNPINGIIGGDLTINPEFKHILSIGFEFETDDLIKFSGQPDGTLINSVILLNDLVKVEKEKDNYLIKRHNTTNKFYNEYVDDTLNNITLKVLNDNGTFGFNEMLGSYCKKIPENTENNDLYVFKSNDGTVYPIEYHRDNNDTLNCAFSNVEWIVTYYTIKQNNNIILQTFFDACIHIIHNLSNLEKIKGDLYFQETNKKVGNLFYPRILYKKPDSNLYYMQSHDSYYEASGKTLGTIHMVPQMTFQCHITHIVNIMKTILKMESVNKHNKLEKEIYLEYETIQGLEKCITELLDDYNREQVPNKQIQMDKKYGKIIYSYLFLIFYKLLVYIEDYQEYIDDTIKDRGYYKDYLSFLPRHSNELFYHKIITLLETHFRINNKHAVNMLMKIIYKPDILLKHIAFRSPEVASYDEDDRTYQNYGNPAYSFISYFTYIQHYNKDWLEENVDQYSSKFPLNKDDNILVENRLFYKEIRYFARTKCGINITHGISPNDIRKIYTQMIDKKMLKPYDVHTHAILYDTSKTKTKKTSKTNKTWKNKVK
jgi:hypothetical protein